MNVRSLASQGSHDASDIRSYLERDGFLAIRENSSLAEPLSKTVEKIGKALGQIMPGRQRALVEEIRPQTMATAVKGSLSSIFGMGNLPLHTDCAHWAVPCRFLVLACANAGPVPTPTILFDSRRAQLDESEKDAAKRAVFLVRNGNKSFYTSVQSLSRGFFRLDPGCMAPLCSLGSDVLRAFTVQRNRDLIVRHDWESGDIVILDNWRTLHGRGSAESTAPGRVLLRTMVK